MASRFIQLENNGWKLTNELGYILQDRAFSVVQARKIVNCADCLCPSEQVTCLRIPCNLVQGRCQNITLPLFDAATRAPYKIKAGALIQDIIVMKRPGACLDDCLQFMLGTICGNDCDTECDPQRWVGESCPISGAQLNQCGVVKVDATKKSKDCSLFLCRTGACPGQCGPKFVTSDDHCDTPVGSAQFQSTCDEDCGTDDHGCPCVVQTDGCCSYCGPCSFAGGELTDCLIGITLLDGSVGQEDILIAIKEWVQCCVESCEEDDDPCAGVPSFGFGRGGY